MVHVEKVEGQYPGAAGKLLPRSAKFISNVDRCTGRVMAQQRAQCQHAALKQLIAMDSAAIITAKILGG